MKNIKMLVLLLIAMLVSFSGFSQNLIKGAGISYFDTPPNTWANPNEQFSSEMAFNVVTKTFYYWNRTDSEWIPFEPDDDVTAFYISDNSLCLFENKEYCIPLDDLNTGTNVNTGNGTPTITGNENAGDTYIDLDTGTYYFFDGSSWEELGSSNTSSITSVGNPDGSITHSHDDGAGNISVFTTDNTGTDSGNGIPTITGNESAGDTYVDIDTGTYYFFDGSSWVESGSSNTSGITSISNPDGSITHSHDDGAGNISVFTTNTGTSVNSGNVIPITTGNEIEGDTYLDLDTGTYYVFDGTSWVDLGSSNTSGITIVNNPDGSITYTHNDGVGNDVSWDIGSSGYLVVSEYSVDSSVVSLLHENSDGSIDNPKIDFPCQDVTYVDYEGVRRVFSDCEGILLDRDLVIQDLSSEGSVDQSLTTSFADAVKWGGFLTDISTHNNVLALATTSASNSGNCSIVSGINPGNQGDANFTTGTDCLSFADNAITFGNVSMNTGDNSIVGGTGNTVNTGTSSVVVGVKLNNSGDNNMFGGSNNQVTGVSSVGGGVANSCQGTGSAFFGSNNRVFSSFSLAIGSSRINSGQASFSGGTSTGAFVNVPATHPTAVNSLSFGRNTQTKGENSVSLGLGTTASSLNQLAIGQYNLPTGTQNVTSHIMSDHVFVVGNGGTSTSPKNGFAIRNDGILQQYPFDNLSAFPIFDTNVAIAQLNIYTASDPNLFTGATVVIQVDNRTTKPGSGPEEFIYNASQNTWELR